MSSLFQRFLESDTGNRLLGFATKHHKRFFVGLICVLMVYVCLCLFSYNPADPAWSHLPADGTATVSNLGGMGGAWLADVLYLFFGKLAWAILLWLVMEAYFVLLPNRYLFPLRFVSYGLLWVSLCLIGVGVARRFGFDPLALAGVTGSSTFAALSGLLGEMGAYVFAFLCLFGFGYLMVSPLYQGRWYFLDFLPKSTKKNAKPKPASPPSPVSEAIQQAIKQTPPKPAKSQEYDGVLNNFLVNSGIQDELADMDDEVEQPSDRRTPIIRTALPPEPVKSMPEERPVPPNPIVAPPRQEPIARPSPVVSDPAPQPVPAPVPTPIRQMPAETPSTTTSLAVHEKPLHQSPAPVPTPSPEPKQESAPQTGKLVYEYETGEANQDYQTPATSSRPIHIKSSDPAKNTVFGGIRLSGVIAHSNVPHPSAYPSRIQLGQFKESPAPAPVAPTPVPQVEVIPAPEPIVPAEPVHTASVQPVQNSQSNLPTDLPTNPQINSQTAPPTTLPTEPPIQPVQSTPSHQAPPPVQVLQSQPVQAIETVQPKPIEVLPVAPAQTIQPATQAEILPAPSSPAPQDRHEDVFNHQSFAISRANRMNELPPLPPLSLLDEPPIHGDSYSESELVQLSELLEIKLKEFGVTAEVMSISQGPVITSFEVALAAGIKASKVTGIAQDLARSLSVMSVRVVEVIAGKPYIGLEIPNRTRQTIRLIELLDTPEYQNSKGFITSAVGKSSVGEVIMTDIYTAPHMLIAGATRSGKSVLVNSMLLSMLLKYTPEELRFVMIDPKLLELTIYDDIPHLLTPVITDMNDSMAALSWCVGEMNRRYHVMNSIKVRQISDFNKKVKEAAARGEPLIDKTWQPTDSVSDRPPILKPMPYIVVVVDEYADLVSQVKQVEELIDALARKSRAAGIHIILATQRPSVDVITGVIKANIPARIALSVRQKVDSRTILDTAGAETLLGWGDMLFIGNGSNDPIRVHGAYVSDDEVDRVCSAWRERGIPDYVAMDAPREFADPTQGEGQDELFGEAVAYVLSDGKTSISALQRHLSIGYNRAAKLIDAMEAQGILSPPDHTNKRTILKK